MNVLRLRIFRTREYCTSLSTKTRKCDNDQMQKQIIELQKEVNILKMDRMRFENYEQNMNKLQIVENVLCKIMKHMRNEFKEIWSELQFILKNIIAIQIIFGSLIVLLVLISRD